MWVFLSFLAKETTVYFTCRSSWCKSCGFHWCFRHAEGMVKYQSKIPMLCVELRHLHWTWWFYQTNCPNSFSPPQKGYSYSLGLQQPADIEPSGPWLISIHHSIIHVGPFPPQTEVLNIIFPVDVAMRFRGAGYSWVSDDVWWRGGICLMTLMGLFTFFYWFYCKLTIQSPQREKIFK